MQIAPDKVMRQVRDHAMVLIDLDGRFASWNEGVGEILRWPEADWLGQPIGVIFTPQDLARGVPERELRTAAEQGRADDDRPMLRRDGERFDCSGSVTALRGDHGALVGYLKVMRDVSAARRQAAEYERALASERLAHTQAQRQGALLRAIVDAIPDAVYIGNAEGITECNAQALALLGASSLDDLRSRIDELGRRFRVRHERDGEPVAPQELPFVRALQGETAMLETWATTAAGQDVLIRGTAAPIRIDGDIVGAVAVNSDLTYRVQFEEQRRAMSRLAGRLHEREEAFRALVGGVRDYAIFTIGTDGLISSWHVGAQLMKGYSADEAIGMPFERLFTPHDREAGRPRFEMEVAAKTGEYKGEGRRLRKTGEPFEAQVVLTALHGPDDELVGYLKMTQDITQRRRAEAELEALLQQARADRSAAEQASESKSEFLATISHELRTPLGAILGWAKVLELRASDAALLRQGLDAITRNARLQVRLIEDLLDMNRIESGHMRLELQPVDPGAVVAAAVEAIEPAASAKSIRVRTRVDADAGPVMADAARLQQIVSNLLGNAVKFTPERGRVEVSVAAAGESIEISVADDGAGMERGFIERAFERFEQQDASSTRRAGGLGLGLAIVRQLAHLHRGTVRAHSDGIGRGSTFTVTLPALTGRSALAARDAEPIAVAAQDPAAGERRLADFTLLLVDDDPDGLDIAAHALREAGATVLTARRAQEALQVYSDQRLDAIVCDIGLPEHDGHEFIGWVRGIEKSRGRHTPAAAFTAYARPDDRRRALQCGFDAHLVKPLSPAALVEAVVDLLQAGIGATGGGDADVS